VVTSASIDDITKKYYIRVSEPGESSETVVYAQDEKEGEKAVGFYILGAHLTKLKHSMEQRIKCATDLALNEHKDKPHIYFVSGYKKGGAMSEAEYMAKEILELYKVKGMPAPTIVMDNEAMFTVMNFLKTIPLINKFKRHIEKVYLITSDYHIARSKAILKQFVDNGLTSNIGFVPQGAEHPEQGKAGRDVWLDTSYGPSTRIACILDERRDRSNASCFAKMCDVIKNNPGFNAKMLLNPEEFSNREMVRLHKGTYHNAIAQVEALVDEYQNNNIPEKKGLRRLKLTKTLLETEIQNYHLQKEREIKTIISKQDGSEGIAEEIAKETEDMYQQLLETQMKIDKIQEDLRGKEVQLIQFAIDFQAPFEGFCIADCGS